MLPYAKGRGQQFQGRSHSFSLYSCFEKSCPTKPCAAMPKGIMGNGGSWSLIEASRVPVT